MNRRQLAGVLSLIAITMSITYTTKAQARCYEEFPIVGRSTCRKFGSWDLLDLPRLALNVGFSVHTVPLNHASVVGTIGKTQSVGVPSAVFKGLDTTAVTFDWGPTGYIAGPVYLGPRLQFGPAFFSGQKTTADGYRVDASAGIYAGGGLLVGAALHPRAILPFGFRLEMLAGGRVVSVTGKTDDPTIGVGPGSALTITAASWLLEPRVVIEYWTASWMNVSLFGGKNLVNTNENTIGLAFGFHMMPYDQPRSVW
jgi:hypothetical protein